MVNNFLTETVRLRYYDKDLYIMEDNLLYKDTDSTIYLVPRGFVTDLYSIPNWVDLVTGDSAGRNPDPCLVHDFVCATHKLIKVLLTEQELWDRDYLHYHYSSTLKKNILVCENIPRELLEFTEEFSKGEANNILGRCMECLDIPKRKLIRFGVCFNFNYFWNKVEYTFDNLYKPFNHYKR